MVAIIFGVFAIGSRRRIAAVSVAATNRALWRRSSDLVTSGTIEDYTAFRFLFVHYVYSESTARCVGSRILQAEFEASGLEFFVRIGTRILRSLRQFGPRERLFCYRC